MTAEPRRSSPERPVPRWVKVLGAVAAAVVLVAAGGVYLAGGFEQRKDWLVRAPGEEIDAGNLVFTLTSATAQRDDSAGRGTWTLLVTGTVRNPHDETLAPRTGDYGNLFARDHAGGTVATLYTIQLGSDRTRVQVPPDDKAVGIVARFEFETFEPGETAQVAVAVMEFTDNSVLGLGGGAKTWNPDSKASLHSVTLPLTVLPPKE